MKSIVLHVHVHVYLLHVHIYLLHVHVHVQELYLHVHVCIYMSYQTDTGKEYVSQDKLPTSTLSNKYYFPV